MRKRSDRPLARAGSSGSGEVVARGRGTRWPWLIVAIAVGAVKVEAYASLLDHRGALIAALVVALVASVVRLRPKPLLIAALVAALAATSVALHPAVVGVALGFGAFALLVVAVLHDLDPASRAPAPRTTCIARHLGPRPGDRAVLCTNSVHESSRSWVGRAGDV